MELTGDVGKFTLEGKASERIWIIKVIYIYTDNRFWVC